DGKERLRGAQPERGLSASPFCAHAFHGPFDYPDPEALSTIRGSASSERPSAPRLWASTAAPKSRTYWAALATEKTKDRYTRSWPTWTTSMIPRSIPA